MFAQAGLLRGRCRHHSAAAPPANGKFSGIQRHKVGGADARRRGMLATDGIVLVVRPHRCASSRRHRLRFRVTVGWSRRGTLYGGDHSAGRDNRLLDPATEPARIRAMYTHPDHVRRGIGQMIIDAGEAAARAEGFKSAQMGATLAGEPLYRRCGYELIEVIEKHAKNGAIIPLKIMGKTL